MDIGSALLFLASAVIMGSFIIAIELHRIAKALEEKNKPQQ